MRFKSVRVRYEGLLSMGDMSARRPGCKSVACLALLALVALVFLLAAGQPTIAVAPESVLQYAILLPGERPATPIDPSGYIQVPYSWGLNHTGGEITIEAWVKRNAADRYETIVGNGHGTGYWLGFHDSGKIRFSPWGPLSSTMSDSVVGAGRWTHIAVTYDGTTRRFFINGVLDKSTTLFSGPLLSAPAGQPLGIGFDRDDTFLPNFFGGWIDNVRIWMVARNASEIRAGMFQSFGAPQPYLLAEWSLDGDAIDGVGSNDGILVGAYDFGNEGAIPHDIRIPQVATAPALDGACGSTEYANATRVTVDGTAVELLHTADDLWVCFDDLSETNLWAQVYLDALYTRLDPAQPEHLQLRIKSDSTLEAREGAGDGLYSLTSAADGKWAGTYHVCCGEYPTYRAEFRIDADLLDGWGHVIGLALGKATGARAGGDLWPALAVSNQPSTWSSTILGSTGPPRTFSGKVVYQPLDSGANPVGIAGMAVNLVGSDANGGEALVATDKTNLDGSFGLTSDDDYTRHRLELGPPPKGYLAKEAQVNLPGVAIDARTLDYGTAAPGTYPDNLFILGDTWPYVVDPLHGPYFLIVASQHIVDSGALDEFVGYKRRMGFTVEVISVETIDASFPGTNRLQRVRALEQARLATHGDRFQYVMLVGLDEVVPFARFTLWFSGHSGGELPMVDLDGCLDPVPNKIKFKLSDWPYVDLVSDFDSNGNGCLADGLKVDTNETPLAPGYTRDTKPAFQHMVTVGRMPFDTESAVRTALGNSMRFEQQSEEFKRRALLAMSNYAMKGQYWDESSSSYKPCPPPKGAEVYGVHKNCDSWTDDGAHLGEDMRTGFLNDDGYLSTYFYESSKPPDASPVISPQPLTNQNVVDELEATLYGHVNLAGHGSPEGVGRTYWLDANGNGLVDSPTAPDPFNINEMKGGALLGKDDLNFLTPDNGYGAVYVTAACSTGSPFANSFGANLLRQGHGVAWVGGLNMVSDSKGTDHDVTEALLHKGWRLGDAVWHALADYANTIFNGSVEISTQLYGDPTLIYWGNPGGQSTRAAWPMLRYDSRGQGYTPLAGPQVPRQLWHYNAVAPGTGALPPSPLVSNSGEVIVAHGVFIDVLRQGQLFQRLDLDWLANGTPALAADGTIYAFDTEGMLYAFPYSDKSSPGQRYRRWKLAVNMAHETPWTSPVVGADGFVVVNWGSPPGSDYSGIALVRPDGLLDRYTTVPGHAIGALAVGADRQVFVATTTGYLAALDFFCPAGLCTTEKTSSVAYSAPPLLAYGSLYTGQVDGTVVKVKTDDLSQQATFQADSEISAGPVIGPAGQVLVGTVNGTLYSLTKDLTLRWQRSIGTALDSVPAFSADALYIVGEGKLQAYSPYSGAELWVRDLGIGAGGGSVAIGYGREIYLQTSHGRVFAYGEGWTEGVGAMVAQAVEASPGVKAMKVAWLAPGSAASQNNGAPSNTDVPQAIALGILLQRSVDGGEWRDRVVLPPGTTVFTDTDVLENSSYAYRAQVLDPDGNDSDWTATLVSVQSLPKLPGAPTLDSVTATGAETLDLEWTSPPGDVVDGYRIERAPTATGAFAPALETGGAMGSAVDSELAPGTGYFYRVIAINKTGESPPSNVQGATTRQQSLPAPQNLVATLQDDLWVGLSWSGGPAGAAAVIEYSEGNLNGYLPLAETSAAGPYHHYPGEPSVYIYRVKFVQGDAESEYAETGLVVIENVRRVYLPLVAKDSGG